ADRVAVMYAGKIIEIGLVDEIFYQCQHPYTQGLLAAMPNPDIHTNSLYAIPGTPPNLLHPPTGDAFAARNKHALKIDFIEEPPMF
ncbi:oligopeptide/dipeptide ABC transporter ATP-binding protein, partial [Bacillus safensis]|uniref:oligopeptide/dipeptide ABC transporter ATP-binding protein n=2 Tax=Bacillaceae TaxID=186817 RepID=UPI002DD43BA3